MADVKALAEGLVALTVKEVQELADFLKSEYGIEPAAAAVVVSGGGDGGGAAGGAALLPSPAAAGAARSDQLGRPDDQEARQSAAA